MSAKSVWFLVAKIILTKENLLVICVLPVMTC